MDSAAVGDDQPDALAAVVRGAAADGDEAVAFFFFIQFHAGGDVDVGGVRNGFVVDGVFHRRIVENIRDLLQDAGMNDTLVGDKKRLRGVQVDDAFRNGFGGAYTDERNVGNKEAVDFFNNSHCGILHCLEEAETRHEENKRRWKEWNCSVPFF